VTLPHNMSEIRQRHVASIFLLSMVLICWLTDVGAFQVSVRRSTSNKVTRPSRTEDVSSVPSSKASSKTSMLLGLRPSSTKTTLRQRLKDKAASLLKFKNADRIAKPPSALFSAAESSAPTAGTAKSKKGVLKRLRYLLLFPLVSELVSKWICQSPPILMDETSLTSHFSYFSSEIPLIGPFEKVCSSCH
jgi:hypothetical protein